jgi:bifunctional DNA-binding transcriptional regulator/antitoxin component of YhaV-PrlF toxin-antitoxin module
LSSYATVKTSVSTRGQVVLPAQLRKRDAIEPGQEFAIERIARGEYRLVRVESRDEGVVDWLLSCPDKGYCVAIGSESTATGKP